MIELLVQRALQDGVTDPRNHPFLLQPQGKSAQAAVLLVHGFTATPYQMLAQAETCAASGFAALGVRLPGHGTTPADLAGRRWEEWLEVVAEGWEILAARWPRIYGVGVSAGALLLLLSVRSRPAAGLVLHSPFLQLRSTWAWAARWAAPFYPSQPRTIPAAKRPFYYAERPMRGIAQLQELVKEVRRGLPQTVPPTLVLGGWGDETIRPESSVELFSQLRSSRAECHLFGREAGHVLTDVDSPCRTAALTLTRDFLFQLEASRSNGDRAT